MRVTDKTTRFTTRQASHALSLDLSVILQEYYHGQSFLYCF